MNEKDAQSYAGLCGIGVILWQYYRLVVWILMPEAM